MDLSAVLAGMTPEPAGGWSAEPPEDWRQGRTLYGGLTAALCARAAQLCVDSPAPLRALQLAFVGPATGRVRFVPTVLRRGRSATFVGVDGFTDAGLCARATLTYGLARDSPIAHDRAGATDVPEPEACTPLPAGAGPAFLAHFDVRPAAGGVPFGGGDPAFAMWVRHRDGSGLDPTIGLVAVADVLPPAVSTTYRELRPMSSMTWSLDVAGAPPPNEWYLLRSGSERAADGYSLQTMGCWDRDRRLLALGRQTVALF